MVRIRRLETRRRSLSLTTVLACVLLLLGALALAGLPALERGDLSLPRSVTRDLIPPGAALVVIDRDGIIRVPTGAGKTLVAADREAVARLAARLVEVDPGRPFAVAADARASYETVDGVISELRRAGVRAIFVMSEQRIIDEEE